MSIEKRPRCTNFSQSERAILIELVAQYKDVVENKRTDAVTLRAKERVWIEITDNFNQLSENYRTVVSLKNCWDNIKRKCRKLNAASKEEVYKVETDTISKDSTELAEDLLLSNVEKILDASLSENQQNHLPLTETPVIHSIYSIKRKNDFSQSQPLLKKSAQEALNIILETNKPLLTKDTITTILEANQQSQLKYQQNELIRRVSEGTVKSILEEKKQTVSKKSAQEVFLEEKTKFLKVGTEHALNEEKRKSELHVLEVEERKLKIELLKLQILHEKEKNNKS